MMRVSNMPRIKKTLVRKNSKLYVITKDERMPDKVKPQYSMKLRIERLFNPYTGKLRDNNNFCSGIPVPIQKSRLIKTSKSDQLINNGIPIPIKSRLIKTSKSDQLINNGIPIPIKSRLIKTSKSDQLRNNRGFTNGIQIPIKSRLIKTSKSDQLINNRGFTSGSGIPIPIKSHLIKPSKSDQLINGGFCKVNPIPIKESRLIKTSKSDQLKDNRGFTSGIPIPIKSRLIKTSKSEEIAHQVSRTRYNAKYENNIKLQANAKSENYRITLEIRTTEENILVQKTRNKK
ncbi:uncharacterized protein LOC142331709 isoform X1 [Lycorma delicatula]|uniref:uncharacterized protein LOC142331709 isoform X1 n=1 Tax=Lycorma delicatula TaxID=130591 RepID=UPI003F513F7F